MPDNTDRIAGVATRHRLSEGAVKALDAALEASGGGGAQWNHPDLGGMGQWTRSGMLQIGDMFNNDLKARVGAALDDLARSEPERAPGGRDGGGTKTASSQWWAGDFGHPSSTGSQNSMRYACFPDQHRLAVEQDGKVTIYDTGSHRLTGFSQSQSGSQNLEFSGPDGRVTLRDLKVVD